MTQLHKKPYKTIVQIILACVLVAFLIVRMDWRDIAVQIVYAQPVFLVLFCVFYLCGIAISAYKWHIIAQSMHFTRTYRFYMETYFVGTFLNNFFPSFIGGDAYRVVALGKNAKRIADSSISVIIDRISGLGTIVFLAGVCGAGYIGTFFNYDGLIGFGVSVLCGVVFLFFAPWLVRYAPRRIRDYVNRMRAACTTKVCMQSIFYACVFDVVGIALANYMLFCAVGLHVSVWQYIGVIFCTNVVASIPISVGNIGTKEWAYIVLFGLVGLSTDQNALVAIVLLSRVLQMGMSFLAIPLYIRQKKHTKLFAQQS